MNGYLWHIAFVNPGSAKLVDRTGASTLSTTDPTVMRIYISDVLSGQELETVLIHELGHAALFSYGLLPLEKPSKKCLMLGIFTGFFQGLMSVIGYYFTLLALDYISPYSKYVVFGIFTILGIKFILESIKCHKLVWGRLFNGSGGMPSSHTTFSSSLAMLIGYKLGFDTPIFAVALIFTFITSYDALGIRYESGKQAIAINYLLKEYLFLFFGD